MSEGERVVGGECNRKLWAVVAAAAAIEGWFLVINPLGS